MLKHVVGFSGGIDSQACADWVLENFPKEDVILMNSNAGGNEHPLTTEHVEWYSANVHPVVLVEPIVADMDGREREEVERRGLKPTDPLTFDLLASLKKCWPTGLQQFCTTHLKLEPQRRWIREHLSDVAYIRYSGVRRDESERRKDTPRLSWDKYFDCELVCPLVEWTKEQCFAFVQGRGERINPLYMMGFSRVGCSPCVNSSYIRKYDGLCLDCWNAGVSELKDAADELARIRDIMRLVLGDVECEACRPIPKKTCPSCSGTGRRAVVDGLSVEDAVRRVVAERDAARAAVAWQPIETAPKDGTWVVLFTAEGGVQCGYWGATYFGSDHSWIQYGHRSDYEEVEGIPTHWMPLPPPPSNEEPKR